MRTVKLVKYLPETGWRPIVLTVDRNDTWMPDRDLLDETSCARIYRCRDQIGKYNSKGAVGDEVDSPPRPTPATTYKTKFKELFKSALVPDKRVGWLLPAVMLGLKIIKKENIDIIYATSPPQTPLLVGCFLAILTGKKLVIDYRDAWSSNTLFQSRYGYHNYINDKLEKFILRRSALIITTTTQIENKLLPKTSTPIVTIPNGFDPEDFVHLTPAPLAEGKVNLVCLGGFSGFRTSRFFVRGVAELDGEIKKKLAVHIIGQSSPEESALLRGIGDMEINLIGSMTHGEALRYLLSADLLMLFIFKEEDSQAAIPGKVYEYLAAKKPIIAFCDGQSALANLLSQLGVKHIVTPDNIQEIVGALSQAVTDSVPLEVDYPCSRFDRKENVHLLAEKLNKMMDR